MTTPAPYSPDTACALAIGATSRGWVEAPDDIPWDHDLASYNTRAVEQRATTLIADLRDNLAALRAVLAPPTATMRILCVGDSITQGLGAAAGASGQMDAHGNGLGGQGYPAWLTDFLARRRIATQITNISEGGKTLRITAPRALAALPAAQPDIVLVHLGTNDIGTDTDDWQNRYGTFVDQLLASSPTVRVACARLAHYRNPGLDAGTGQINTWVDNVVAARKATGRVVAADMTPISTHWTADGTHPLDAAYLTMAKQWIGAINPWLPQG
ncbi:GDSL-type esterase/lipase family protein [Kitasatospora sp. NPDC101235]|uniref:GDSL-type esterase/lipase family protein n=1 Tax=Kitasatospora sp. NPDC101235 TaxID=3364101 RepID=UPI0037F65A96